MGRTDIKIVKGTIVGYIEENPTNNKKTSVYLSMESIFQGMPIPTEEEEEEGKIPDGTPFLVAPPEEPDIPLEEAKISDHWGNDYKKRIHSIIHKHRRLFKPKLGMFNDDVRMPIPFRKDADISKLKQAPLVLLHRDKVEMDRILDPLAKEERVIKVPINKPSAASSPAFVIWKRGKPRVVVDLRRVNTCLFPDVYPLPRQDDILAALGGSIIFSSLDMTKGFFQQKIEEKDQWKTAFVTPHRGQEMLTVATMGLANSPGFFQHRMESLFADYLWKFVLVYVDDIIVFSKNLETHLSELDLILKTLEQSGVTVSLAKCYFGFPSIQALGHKISRLGLSTLQEKIEAIRMLPFPTTITEIGDGTRIVWLLQKPCRLICIKIKFVECTENQRA
jgi:hypothetical protein